MESSPHSGRATVIGRSLGLIILGAVLGVGSTLAVVRGTIPGVPHDDSPVQLGSRYGCVETMVTDIHPSTDASGAGSGFIQFRDDIAPGRGARDHNIMGVTLAYTTVTPNMSIGDHVRVCLTDVPEKDKSSAVGGCDPEQDPRGRQFVIYDRATQALVQYSYGTHGCGGA
ncbi:MAG TPA: hypothetical protein VGC72_09955 [Candidatus Elarobacter sp.]|jgi:hypothetical protein